jgi:hypothetical protein
LSEYRKRIFSKSNLSIDDINSTTALDRAKLIVALQWGITQDYALGNIKINLSFNSVGHIGINLSGGSIIAVTDI